MLNPMQLAHKDILLGGGMDSLSADELLALLMANGGESLSEALGLVVLLGSKLEEGLVQKFALLRNLVV